jgi:protein-S-isoprenylcysteine O-methyltransferase
MMKKVAHGLLVSATILVLPAAFRWEIITYPQIWLLIAIGVLATVFQPAYQATEGSRTKQDRGTAIQIVWTIYITQLAAVMEATLIRYPESFAWDTAAVIAAVIMLAGLGLRSWSVYTLGKFFTWNIEVQSGQGVIRSGPYRFVRHPSYTGAFMTYAGTAVLLHCWWSLALALVVMPIAFFRRIWLEEQLLRSEISDYDDYARGVKAVVPWVV